MTRIVIVGAGPAGIRAAETLCRAGLRPIVIDENAHAGGQGYRRLGEGLSLDLDRLMGGEAEKYRRLHDDFAALRASIDHRPRTTVWGCEDGRLYTVSEGRSEEIAYDAAILATGAMDRIMPVPGWTLPGVFTLGGAQIALKDQGCLIGKRVLFYGASPLLALAAFQYRAFGAEIAAVCDTGPLTGKIAALPDLLAAPGTLLRGVRYLARLRVAGIPLHFGARLLGIEGKGGVEAVRIEAKGKERLLPCDAVAFGFGLKPETQLAELLGAKIVFDPHFRLWLPATDADGRAGERLYLAGDGLAVGGADAAEASGRLAAHALLSDLRITADRGEVPALRKRLGSLRRFQRGLARALPWPAASARALGDELVLCRCENVTVGEVRSAMDAALGPVEVNRVKAITRCGMGRCQGRVCGQALQEIVADHAGIPIKAAGRLRAQAPVKPVPVSAVADFT